MNGGDITDNWVKDHDHRSSKFSKGSCHPQEPYGPHSSCWRVCYTHDVPATDSLHHGEIEEFKNTNKMIIQRLSEVQVLRTGACLPGQHKWMQELAIWLYQMHKYTFISITWCSPMHSPAEPWSYANSWSL